MVPVDSNATADGTFSTSSSLLAQVQARDPAAWRRFAALYGPLVYRWARAAGVSASDAADVVQEVFRSVFAAIGSLRRDRAGDSFRNWLWAVTRNKVRDHYRRLATRPQAAGGSSAHQRLQETPAESSDDAPAGSTHELVGRAMELARDEFETRTWEAFYRTTAKSQSPAEVAQSLGMSVAAVYMAKSRVLRKLRELLSGSVD